MSTGSDRMLTDMVDSMPEFLKSDLVILSQLAPSDVQQFWQRMASEPRMLTSRRVFEIATNVFDENQAVALTRMICNFAPSARTDVLNYVDRIRQSEEWPESAVMSFDLATLKENLSIVLASAPPIAQMHRGIALVRRTGNESHKVEFVCDLRTVFDDSSEAKPIAGFVPLINVRWQYVRQTGVHDVFEIVLTEGELNQLIECAMAALRDVEKLEAVIP